jgi:hypothetical protein
MTGTKYIGMDVHKESISIAVINGFGKVVMESVIETKANMILQFTDGLRGELYVTFEEGTWAAWLYDLCSIGQRRVPTGHPGQRRTVNAGRLRQASPIRKQPRKSLARLQEDFLHVRPSAFKLFQQSAK